MGIISENDKLLVEDLKRKKKMEFKDLFHIISIEILV